MELIPTDTVNLGGFWHYCSKQKCYRGDLTKKTL